MPKAAATYEHECEMFFARALEKILAERDVKRSSFANLRRACETALEQLRKEQQEGKYAAELQKGNEPDGSGVLPPVRSAGTRFLDAEKYFAPFELACACKSSKIVVTALDALQKLIAYGYLTGGNGNDGAITDVTGSAGGALANTNSTAATDNTTAVTLNVGVGKRRLIERVVDTICACFGGEQTDEAVQLQVVKALLTVVTSQYVAIHEGTVLQAVRTCYNMYLASRSVVIQATAKASLTQMITQVFMRAEAARASKLSQNATINSTGAPVSTNPVRPENEPPQAPPSQSQSAAVEKVNNDNVDGKDGGESDAVAAATAIVDQLIVSATQNGDVGSRSENENGNDVDETASASVSVSASEADTVTGTSSGNGTGVASSLTVDVDGEMVQMRTGSLSQGDTGRASMTSRSESDSLATPSINSSLQMETIAEAELENAATSSSGAYASFFADAYEKDAFLILRSLCKLSVKPVAEPVDAKSHELRSKLLSLQLLLGIVRTLAESAALRKSDVFVSAIKQYLCVSLTRNATSALPEVFELAVAIFLALLSAFKIHLKMQIEVFFKELLLHILESPTAALGLKYLAVMAVGRICADAQCVVDLYLNYDCDLGRFNLFERLVGALAKHATVSSNADDAAAAAAASVTITLSGALGPTGSGPVLGPSPGLGPASSDAQPHVVTLAALRIKSLECLVGVLRCMVDWSRELYQNPNSQSHLGQDYRPNVQSQGRLMSPAAPEGDGERVSLASSVDDSTSRVNAAMAAPGTAADNPAAFETLKHQKEIIEAGYEKFAKSPLKGIRFLQERGFVGKTPAEVAAFLHECNDKLDKTALGDFLGENERFEKEVMYAYVDQHDFCNTEFLPALRKFLDGFRLPGEAQKVDRLMEKFAARFIECNPKDSVFASADAAYVLAYSVIILTTDLHNPQVKAANKMTKEQYVRMNRGINDSNDLPTEYLTRIYDEIRDSAIATTGVTNRLTNATRASSNMVNDKQRRTLFNMEMEAVAATAKTLMETVSHVDAQFTSATHQEHIRPMFKLVWTPLLAAFSVALQHSNDAETVRLALEGVRAAIRVACIFKLELERGAYVQALARFTLLNSAHSANDLRWKNVETLKTLIAVAYADGNYLGSSWADILKCISQLDAQAAARPLAVAGAPPVSTTAAVAVGLAAAAFRAGGTSSASLEHEVVAAETSSQSVLVAVDRVFAGSVKLDGDAIVEFVRALCAVSLDELAGAHGHGHSHHAHGANSPARMYSLQKLVEIAYYNMGRVRIQWSRIWQVLGEHFNTVGCSDNEEVAVFAIDSLRQLAAKFIEKGEFAHFRFQKDFLKPFEVVMKRSRLPAIRDMIVRCLVHMVNSQAQNIKSGWKNVFAVFALAASDPDPAIVELAFVTAQRLVGLMYPEALAIVHYHSNDNSSIAEADVDAKTSPVPSNANAAAASSGVSLPQETVCAMLDAFHDCVKCLAEFACNPHLLDVSIPMESIRLMRACAEMVASKPALFNETSRDAEINWSALDVDDRVWLKGWFPILFELTGVIQRCKLDVRTRALTVTFEVVKTYGSSFQASWWRDLFRVVLRIFDNARTKPQAAPEASGTQHQHEWHVEKLEWITTTCQHALYALVDVFTQFFDVLGELLFSDLLSLIRWCVAQDNEQLARSATNCLENVLISNGARFSRDTWRAACACLAELFRETTPHQLLTWRSAEANGASKRVTFHEPIAVAQTAEAPAATSPTADAAETPQMKKTRSPSAASIGAPAGVLVSHPGRADAPLFASLMVKCIVQRELVQTVDNFLFYPSNSRKDSLRNWQNAKMPLEKLVERDQTRSQAEAVSAAAVRDREASPEEQAMRIQQHGMLPFLCLDDVRILVDCLLDTHAFSRRFNADNEQRDRLRKAGLKGTTKPNLYKQETASLECVLRILFRCADDPFLLAPTEEDAGDEQRAKVASNLHSLLVNVCVDALSYFASVQSDEQREAWNNVLLLVLHRSIRLPDERFQQHAHAYYRPLCDLVPLNSPTEIRTMLAAFFKRCGLAFGIGSASTSAPAATEAIDSSALN